jgi:hypothetical protein
MKTKMILIVAVCIMVAGSASASPLQQDALETQQTTGSCKPVVAKPVVAKPVSSDPKPGDEVIADVEDSKLKVAVKRVNITKVSPQPVALADSLVAHWTFDERRGRVVYDAKGGNDGIIYGAKWVYGLFGGALSFDGKDDYISILEKTLPKTGPYSISLWLRADGDYKSKYNAQGHDQNACWFHYYVSDKARFTLGSKASASGRTVIRGADNRSFAHYRLGNNMWAHTVVVFDSEGKVIKFYNNSNANLTNRYRDKGWGFSDTHVVIGSMGGKSAWFKGLMDDIRIYDRALSGPEVEELYRSGLLPVPGYKY